MKFKWNDDDQKYLKLGLTLFGVVVLSILAYQVLNRIPILTVGVMKLLDCLRPILYGLAFAYVLIPCLKLFENIAYKIFKKPSEHGRRVIRMVCVLVTWGLTLTLLSALVMLVVPELASSVEGIITNTTTQVNRLIRWVMDILQDNPEFRKSIISQIKNLYSDFTTLMSSLTNLMDMIPDTGTLVSNLSSGVISAVSTVFHFAIGLIVSIYVMSSKELFTAQTKKMVYAVFPAHTANGIIGVVRSAHQKFGGFFIGKIIDSIVIGILCFILLTVFRIPYAVLVSFVVGVTNIIPFFGPFIGAIPCAIIILLSSPLKCLYFIIIIIVLQQVDGNILGPKILSSSIGLSSFWVMFAILVFGGLFGFWGLLCGVPLFAVIYELISEAISKKLRHRRLPTDTVEYESIDYVNSQTGEAIKFKEKDELDVSQGKQKQG